jgi:hypothetical protein
MWLGRGGKKILAPQNPGCTKAMNHAKMILFVKIFS